MTAGVWTQWSDISTPSNMRLFHGQISESDREAITFYAARYTGAALDLSDVPHLPNLRVLQLPNAGYEDALEFAREGLTICNARGVHDASTAELALALTLTSLRGIPDFVHAQKESRWSHEHRPALADKKVAVIGYGSIGTRIAKLFQAFEAHVTPYSQSGANGALPIADLDADLWKYDIVLLIAPATPETQHLINRERIAAMKKGALLVNVARGSLIDTDALLEALTTGHIHAAVDVTDPEPLPKEHPLWQAPNLLISPHVGGDTSAFEPRMRRLVEDQLKRYALGQPLLNVVWPTT